MKLLIQSAMIFFGTLMAAAVVALGEPARADADTARSVPPGVSHPVPHDGGSNEPRVDVASTRPAFSLR